MSTESQHPPVEDQAGSGQDARVEDETVEIDPEDLPGIKGALLRYRVMAWIVGVLLVVLVLIGLPLKYGWGIDTVVRWTGMPHGWLYMVLLITAYDLARRIKWSLWWVLAIMAAGTVPFLSFVAEHYATKDVRRRVAVVNQTSRPAQPSDPR